MGDGENAVRMAVAAMSMSCEWVHTRKLRMVGQKAMSSTSLLQKKGLMRPQPMMMVIGILTQRCCGQTVPVLWHGAQFRDSLEGKWVPTVLLAPVSARPPTKRAKPPPKGAAQSGGHVEDFKFKLSRTKKFCTKPLKESVSLHWCPIERIPFLWVAHLLSLGVHIDVLTVSVK